MEVSFADEDGIIAITEDVLCAAFEAGGAAVKAPFPRMTYDEAMLRCELLAMPAARGHFWAVISPTTLHSALLAPPCGVDADAGEPVRVQVRLFQAEVEDCFIP
jgi:hypothetical protein